ncbi:hypothetical protein SLS55_005864 [Diplodia seriata]|uniref:Uncharacterized protein n=1 Tax=Diplodia seriata TaxID=420778 RepID=A0ABR3CHX5_9PEZI
MAYSVPVTEGEEDIRSVQKPKRKRKNGFSRNERKARKRARLAEAGENSGETGENAAETGENTAETGEISGEAGVEKAIEREVTELLRSPSASPCWSSSPIAIPWSSSPAPELPHSPTAQPDEVEEPFEASSSAALRPIGRYCLAIGRESSDKGASAIRTTGAHLHPDIGFNSV